MIFRRIAPALLIDELDSRGISIRSLGRKDSPNYIGISDKTIFRGIKNQKLSVKTLDALSNIVNVDYFTLDDEIDILKEEIKQLKLENKRLKNKIARMKKSIK